MPRIPNFFILGAGRCGTTSLHQQLAQHPDVFMSPNKEPTFFCDFFGMQNPWEYLELFGDATHERVVGESSHAYLTCPASAQMLSVYAPQARFVAIFRNPIDRAYSLYCWMTAAGNEWLAPFEKALEAEDRRATDPRFFRNVPQYFYNYLYFQSGLYSQQIARYLQLFPRGQFLFLRFEDLASNVHDVLQRVFRFLQVDPEFVPCDLSPANQSQRVRSARLQHLLRRRIEPALVKLRLGRVRPLVDRLASWNISSRKVAPLSDETRLRLVERYRREFDKFESLTGLDIASWQQVPMAQTPLRQQVGEPHKALHWSGPQRSS